MSWMNTREYAAYRGISVSKANKDRVTGEGAPYTKTGRLVRYSQRRVDEWLSQFEVRSTSETSDRVRKAKPQQLQLAEAYHAPPK
jgi:hypothetical protein